MLPPEDQQFLEGKGYVWTTYPEAGWLCVVIKDYRLPQGYVPQTTDLMLRLPPGFPDAAPDMWWCDPRVVLARTSAPITGAEASETHLGRSWQRFSRHFQPGEWRPGKSGVQSFMALIRKVLVMSAEQAA